MKGIVAFIEVRGASPRLATAQEELADSIVGLGLKPLPIAAGKKLSIFGEVLEEARSASEPPAFVWCNSDVILTRNPYDVPEPEIVSGFHRREVPSGTFATGVDMYYIPFQWWDHYLSKDVPRLYVGASYVDWWISRAMAKAGAYQNLQGYIDHASHPLSAASGSDSDPYYQSNFRAYNAWAKRNGLDPISVPPFLVPGVGHVWGVRDLIKRIKRC